MQRYRKGFLKSLDTAEAFSNAKVKTFLIENLNV